MKKPVWTKPEGVGVNVSGASGGRLHRKSGSSDSSEFNRGWRGWGRIFGRGVMVRRAGIQHIIFSDPQRLFDVLGLKKNKLLIFLPCKKSL